MKTTQPLYNESIWKPHLAAFAPLPEPFIRHIFNHIQDLKPSPVATVEVLQRFDQVWVHIQRARQIVSPQMVAAVEAQNLTKEDRITRVWFGKRFQEYAKRETVLPPTTIQAWIDRNLLRDSNNRLEPNSVSSMYMMRYLFKSEQKFWMPRRLKPTDPWFYVWGLLPNENTPRIYPYPLPKNAPINALYWTQWIGASWLPGWMYVPGVGALAWGKITEFAGNWYWDVSEEDLSFWDASLVRNMSVSARLSLLRPIMREQSQGLPDAEKRYKIMSIHDLAQSVLKNVGEPILAGYMAHYFSDKKPPTKPYVPF